MDQIRILVVDDHALFRKGVIYSLQSQPDMVVVGETDSVAGALALTAELLPDVVLLDITLSDGSGLEAVPILHRQCPVSKVVILTVSEDEGTLLQALKDGASGYLLKGISAANLAEAIRAIHCGGETYISPTVAGRILSEWAVARSEPDVLGELSDRERTILQKVADGLTNREIAAELHLSEKTVKYYVTNILQKLQVRNRVEAALLLTRRENGPRAAPKRAAPPVP